MAEVPTPLPVPSSAPVPSALHASRTDKLLKVGVIIDFILLILGISFASVKIQNPGNTTYTPTVILSMFVSTIVLTGVIIWFSDITNAAILFTFATFAFITTLLTYATILVRMRYYASN